MTCIKNLIKNSLKIHISYFIITSRFVEWIANTSGTWSSIWHITSQFLGKSTWQIFKLTRLTSSIIFLDRHKPISYIFGLPLYVITIHWIFAASLILYDIIECPKFLERFKNQNEPKDKVKNKELTNLAKLVLVNQLVILPASMVLTHYLLRFSNDLHLINFLKIPSFSLMIYKFTLCMMIYEVVFFYLYWMLHHPLLHKPVHKSNPTSNSSQYQQPIQHMLLSIVTPALAIFLTKCEIVTSLFFLVAIVVGPIFENPGLRQPVTSSNESHECQQYFNEFYGSNDMVNILHDTCKNFLKSENFENHRVLLSMKPPKRKCNE